MARLPSRVASLAGLPPPTPEMSRTRGFALGGGIFAGGGGGDPRDGTEMTTPEVLRSSRYGSFLVLAAQGIAFLSALTFQAPQRRTRLQMDRGNHVLLVAQQSSDANRRGLRGLYEKRDFPYRTSRMNFTRFQRSTVRASDVLTIHVYKYYNFLSSSIIMCSALGRVLDLCVIGSHARSWDLLLKCLQELNVRRNNLRLIS